MERGNQVSSGGGIKMTEKKPIKKTYVKIPENVDQLTDQEIDQWANEAYDLIIKRLKELDK